nr:MAG TPA: hypothetical protein [Caudoviricetes sp.]
MHSGREKKGNDVRIGQKQNQAVLSESVSTRVGISTEEQKTPL